MSSSIRRNLIDPVGIEKQYLRNPINYIYCQMEIFSHLMNSIQNDS